ncbi:DNA methylase N-4 [Marichromatium purpuratum 984]|uniref:site-specific DNA-methyltransferase (adenine-specific) n=1 Tax=Marichromatium purpuratum 984 TaxID=765910 RepID=W0E0Z7_MARPU|nr:site-specific DNA-methyltransferase [Marichromatium purpuratum]AHF04560.1 DNA methylase N-4 [Marichromatium purpuratum 984]
MKKLTREDGASPDLVADNIERLRELFPEVFADGLIDFDALKETLGDYVDDREERYSFTWNGKSRAKQIAQTPSMGTLRPCPEESVNWDTTKNIFIEGDNLEVLKLLQKSYHRKVKMIYIDPPYNTGKEFIYPDKWQDNLDTYLRYTGQVDDEGFKVSANAETSGRYHTNWLNMMYPRLKLARNLLRDDGLLFVSIDDHEAHNLRHILDEVFGVENFMAAIAWEKRYTRSNNAKAFYSLKDTLLVYRRSDVLEHLRETRTEKADSGYSNPDKDPRGDWTTSSFVNPATKEKRPNLVYPITAPDGRVVEHPTHAWKNSEEEYRRLVSENRLWWGQDGDAKYPRKKIFLSEAEGMVPVNIWDHKEAGTTDEGGLEVKALFDGKAVFDNPKPTRLIRKMLGLSTNTNSCDIVLDFFAGSGSTGDAVMQQNMDDGGNRRFILVQLPEHIDDERFGSVASISIARLRAASAKVAVENRGFRAFKLSSSNIKPWDAEFDSIDQDLVESVDNIKPNRSEDDVLYELLLKYGLDLAIPTDTRDIEGRKVTVIGAGALIVCLADNITLEVVSGITALKDEFQPEVMRVVFKDAGFADDVVKTNAVQILRQAGIDDVKSL